MSCLIKQSQVPEDILSDMHTADLMQICLTYPLKGDVYAYSNIKDGVEHISQQFNAFRELLMRKDNFISLKLKLEQCRFNLDNELKSDKKMTEKGKRILDIAIVESFLSFDDVLSNSDYTQKKQLAQTTKEILNYKLQNIDDFGVLSITSTAFLLGKTLQKMNKFSGFTESTAKFLDNNITVNENNISEIVQTFNKLNL